MLVAPWPLFWGAIRLRADRLPLPATVHARSSDEVIEDSDDNDLLAERLR
jgi:hypothetical protein